MNRFGPRAAAGIVALWWAALALAVIAVRPATVADETRYLSVAWAMHQSGDFVLLRLNGALYGHKPPLLFWLIEAGWQIFGVQLWWPRLLTAAFGVGGLYAVFRLARQLAPERDDMAVLAVMITATSLLWIAFAGAVMFDLALAFFVLLALVNVVRAARGAGLPAWVLAGIAMGLGILVKGPVALLHVLPVALLGPWWAGRALRDVNVSRARWYGGVAMAVLVAAAVALAWAIPAALAGGEAFRTEILWRQSAGRIASEGYHGRPFWFHLAVLPAILLPWFVVPAWWRGIAGGLRDRTLLTTRFAIAWVVPVFLAFSAMKGKQVHYLLPEVAGFALLAAVGMAAGMRRPYAAVTAIGSAWIASAVVLYLVLGPALLKPYDLREFAGAVAAAQQRGQPVAHFGVYHGEYEFLGRLSEPLQVVHGPQAAVEWARRHPGGAIVWRMERPGAVAGVQPLASQRYRSGQVFLLRSEDVPAMADAWTGATASEPAG